jgi:ComF family protein
MLGKVKNLFFELINLVAPERRDFNIVKKLKREREFSLKEAPKVEGMSWITPLFHYKDDRVRAIVWELKYKENTLVLEHIGKLLYEEIIALISEISTFNQDAEFVLIPIPISKERRIERGYNQSEYIAKAVLESDTPHILLYAPQWFQKIRDTSSQNKSQSREERMKNLIGCFEANPLVAGKYIILIDDVITTGSTLSEARKTLLEAGARDVFAFTVAH